MEHRIRSRLLRTTLLFTLLLGWSALLAPVTAQQHVGIYYDFELDETRGRIYASNQTEGSLIVISMATLEVIDHLSIGALPSGIDISQDGNQLAVALQGQGEVALVDLDTLTVTQRLFPAVKIGPNRPIEVEYGRPGRLYTAGNPGLQGMDYIHVFDTSTNVEIARSGEAIRYKPHLAITADGNKLYVGESENYLQQLYRFDISGDQTVLDALAPEISLIIGSICVTSSGQVITAGGQLWSGDLSQNLLLPPNSYGPYGSHVECDPVKPRAYFTGFNATVGGSGVSIFDTSTSTFMLSFARSGYAGPGRLNAAGDILYVATDSGIQALDLSRLSVIFFPQVSYRHCPGFSDPFDNPYSGWRAAEDESARSAYSNGEFRVLSKEEQVIHFYRAPSCASAPYQVEVSARWINRPGDTYGLIFDIAGDLENYYLFEVNPSKGTYRLELASPDYTYDIVPPTRHLAIRTGTQTNRLSVGAGNAIVLQINGQTVRYEPISLIGATMGVGVFASGRSNSEAGFDDFKITSPFYPSDYPNPYP